MLVILGIVVVGFLILCLIDYAEQPPFDNNPVETRRKRDNMPDGGW